MTKAASRHVTLCPRRVAVEVVAAGIHPHRVMAVEVVAAIRGYLATVVGAGIGIHLTGVEAVAAVEVEAVYSTHPRLDLPQKIMLHSYQYCAIC